MPSSLRCPGVDLLAIGGLRGGVSEEEKTEQVVPGGWWVVGDGCQSQTVTPCGIWQVLQYLLDRASAGRVINPLPYMSYPRRICGDGARELGTRKSMRDTIQKA